VTVGSGVQPRYIYPLIIILGGVALAGFARSDLGLGRLQLVIVGLGLTAANSVALHTNLRRYITGMDSQSFNLNANIEWWWNSPISPMVVWAIGSVAFAAALGTLTWMIWDQRAAAASADIARSSDQESVSS
jgi:drug/metabolite transporter (DMT)-like permease